MKLFGRCGSKEIFLICIFGLMSHELLTFFKSIWQTYVRKIYPSSEVNEQSRKTIESFQQQQFVFNRIWPANNHLIPASYSDNTDCNVTSNNNGSNSPLNVPLFVPISDKKHHLLSFCRQDKCYLQLA